MGTVPGLGLREVVEGSQFEPYRVRVAFDQGGIDYAAQFGIRPHRDFRRSQLILDPPDAHPRTGAVVFGKDGKPLYVQGPHDNVQAILRQLDRTAGEGKTHYLLQIGDPMGEEEWDG